MITRTESYTTGELLQGIKAMEYADWTVKSISAYVESVGWLVTFERERP